MHARRVQSLGALALLGPAILLVHSAEPRRSAQKAVTAVLWRDPGRMAARDLFWGSGARDRVPVGPFRFQEEDTSGTQPKVLAADARGVVWDVKFGTEPRAEIAANRLLWGFGYLVEETYFVAEGVIHGARRLKRAGEHVTADGRFRAARFRRRNPDMVRTGDGWAFGQNPFVGRQDLSGLVILMTLINNWDIDGPRNNAILRATAPDGSVEHRYIVADLGGTFGRMGGFGSNHSKWNLADFLTEGFIERVGGDRVELDYDGLDPSLDAVPIEHARWFARLASQLSDAQLRRAFEAAAATPAEIEGFSGKLAAKIAELTAAVNATPSRYDAFTNAAIATWPASPGQQGR
jgi:hypothetical protein